MQQMRQGQGQGQGHDGRQSQGQSQGQMQMSGQGSRRGERESGGRESQRERGERNLLPPPSRDILPDLGSRRGTMSRASGLESSAAYDMRSLGKHIDLVRTYSSSWRTIS